VTYELPLAALGRIADRLVIRRVLEWTFRARHARMRAILG
jgi:ligand-binding SRPBCC domain-containing protein